MVNYYGAVSKYLKYFKQIFIGKSLIKKFQNTGGQNPIEAARLGNRIVHGPNIENFVEVYHFLKKHRISTKIKSYKDLEKLVIKFKRKKNYSNQIIIYFFS